MKKTILSLLCLILLCGCSGYKEINDGYLVTSVAFEELDGGGLITANIILPQTEENMILSAWGGDFDEAFSALKKAQVRSLYFEHCGTVVLNPRLKPQAFEILELCKNKIKIPIAARVVYCHDAKALFSADRTGYDVISLLKNNNARQDNQIFEIEQTADNLELPFISISDKTMIFEGEIK